MPDEKTNVPHNKSTPPAAKPEPGKKETPPGQEKKEIPSHNDISNEPKEKTFAPHPGHHGNQTQPGSSVKQPEMFADDNPAETPGLRNKAAVDAVKKAEHGKHEQLIDKMGHPVTGGIIVPIKRPAASSYETEIETLNTENAILNKRIVRLEQENNDLADKCVDLQLAPGGQRFSSDLVLAGDLDILALSGTDGVALARHLADGWMLPVGSLQFVAGSGETPKVAVCAVLFRKKS